MARYLGIVGCGIDSQTKIGPVRVSDLKGKN
jgi:hypothetical protein